MKEMEGTTYLDYSATTPVDPRVVEAMVPYLTERFGNPNSLYRLGREAHGALEDARERVARSINAAAASEIVFMGCGTESDNAAIFGIATANGRSSGHVVVSAFEHHAVLEPAHALSKRGFDVTELKPRTDGTIYPEDLEAVMRDDTVLVSVMHGNNEIGTLQPIAELARIAHARGAAFHSDAAQTLGKVDVDVQALGVDAMSFSGHKIYAPKGVGVLYLKRGTPFAPQMLGGGQESRRRSGTQNVAAAVAFARALEIMDEERPTEAPRLASLRDRLVEQVLARIEHARLNAADAPERLPHIANFVIPGCEGEAMLLHLDAAGFAVATGSACSSGSLKPSHVLLSIGLPPELAHGSLRVSLGRWSTDADVDAFVDALVPVVEKLRAMNPLYEKTIAALTRGA